MSWLVAVAVMVVVAYAVLALLAPDPFPDGYSPTTPTSSVLETPSTEDIAGSNVGAEMDAAPLLPGTCTATVFTDDDFADPVVVVPCTEPHDTEVVAQLPVTDEDSGGDACRAAAALTGVPVEDEAPPLAFRIGVFRTTASTLECTVVTRQVTGSLIDGGYDTLVTVEQE